MNTGQTLTALLWVATGGALGSSARYLSMVLLGQWLGSGFPWGTLFVNIVGSFVMGVLAELGALAWQPSQDIKLFLMTGILGGFTTFSTFSLDVALLVERHDWAVAAFYVAVSVLASVGALFAAMALVRNLV
ncbi:fluoride efflux transporter CrcB [Magnetospirillum gryphiswaldense]|uniref:Fluoride-specific ion channel FluC n=1 Tax=Magnetospirillum gryphiswaldense TaxID=55518 RepID=A4U0J6_9PROT|nr:fluoride efflux transporter CrcB [Magnetospirillum gryphiswaldense]AVM75355.1 Putative fluoride ion transporter CrcB [Magnetospirillum gryphiswaldense MSR-1]AVM79258.1 Putative fluoride ion transporter CrcB [Magnetospirillum gryphiswaldense]CAM76403.1 Camphor resistance CrcB protein [Magnetospirillum gryphiswaldense MSR-1]